MPLKWSRTANPLLKKLLKERLPSVLTDRSLLPYGSLERCISYDKIEAFIGKFMKY